MIQPDRVKRVAPRQSVTTALVNYRDNRKDSHRPGLALLLGLAALLSFSALAWGADSSDAPELKPDTPKMDTLPPPKGPTVLKGGVQHQEQGASAKANKLKGSAGDSNKGLMTKLFPGKAKTDSNANTLKAGGRTDNLNSQVESGIGIIGVKFVLSFGRPPIINRVFPGTPAAQVGLRNNDMIVAVDGVPTMGLSKEEVYQMIVGTPNTPVTVSVRREGDFMARTMNRMDFNDITDPVVKRDYLMSM